MSWWVALILWVGMVMLMGLVVATTRAGWKMWVFLVVVAGVVITGATVTTNHQDKSCEQKGGHSGPKSLCLTPDGRVIE